jgi:hypothetical protein
MMTMHLLSEISIYVQGYEVEWVHIQFDKIPTKEQLRMAVISYMTDQAFPSNTGLAVLKTIDALPVPKRGKVITIKSSDNKTEPPTR